MLVARIFLGVERRHPSAPLCHEMGMLPLKWEAMKRVVDFLGTGDESG